MTCVMRASDCSTSVGIDRADEAAGICALLLAAEATSAVNKPTRAIKRVKLADIKFVVLPYKVRCEYACDLPGRKITTAAFTFSGAVSNDSSMTWTQPDSR